MNMNINMETFTLIIVLGTSISTIVILLDIVKRIEMLESTLPNYINKLSKNNTILSKNDKTFTNYINALYKKIEQLFETNARNEMEKEDEKSFINKLMYCVKMNNENITILFENNELNDARNKDIEENLTTLFKNGNVYDEEKKQN